jgi:hypothetical protein
VEADLRAHLQGEMRQFGLLAILLSAIAALLYAPNAIHGGFLSDAWSNFALYEFAPVHGFGHILSYFLEQPNIAPRPLQAVYLLTLSETFGIHVSLWLTLQNATFVGMALMLFLLLRRLSVPAFDAGCIAVLLLVFPAVDSVHFWTAMIWAPLSIGMALLGFILGLAAFDTESKRARLLLHAVSLLLFVASLLLYEVTLLLMLCSVLLYRLRVPWRVAAWRWAVDCIVLIPLVLTVTLASSAGHQETEAGLYAHASAIFTAGRLLFTTIVLPLGTASWYVIGLLALIPATALLVQRSLGASDPDRKVLKRWLIVLLGGLLVVALGYAMYIPGTDYYNPVAPGVGDRINAVASIGWVLIVYSLASLAATVAFRGIPRGRMLSSAGAALACALIAVGWIKVINSYSDAFISAYGEDVRVLSVVRETVPKPVSGSTIWTFGQPIELRPGVPVFGNTWDMTGSVQLTYDDPTLTSLVADEGTIFHCALKGVIPGGVYAVEGKPDPTYYSKYGQTYFVDTTNGRAKLIRNQAQCRDLSHRFPLSPALPPA